MLNSGEGARRYRRSGKPGKSEEQVRSGLNWRSGVMHLQSQQMKASGQLGGLRNQSLTHLFRLLPSNHPVNAPLDVLKLHGDLQCFQVRRVQRFDLFVLSGRGSLIGVAAIDAACRSTRCHACAPISISLYNHTMDVCKAWRKRRRRLCWRLIAEKHQRAEK